MLAAVVDERDARAMTLWERARQCRNPPQGMRIAMPRVVAADRDARRLGRGYLRPPAGRDFLPVDFDTLHAPHDAARILYLDLVARGVIAEGDPEAGPVARNARIEIEGRAAQPEA